MNFLCKPHICLALVVIIAVAVETSAEETTAAPSDLTLKFQKAMSDLNATLSSAYAKLSDETKKNIAEASKKIDETVKTLREKGMELYEGQKTETKKA